MRSRRRPRRRERGRPALLNVPFGEVRNPLPPVEWVSAEGVRKIHEAALEILENTGLDFLDDEALHIWEQAGARVDHQNRHVWPDRGLIMEAVGRAPDQFTWRARNSNHNVHIGGNHVTFAPSSGMAYISSLDAGRRTGSLEDFETILRLAQACNLLHFAGGPNIACQDIPTNIRHLKRLFAVYTLTDKPARDVGHGRVIPADNLEMARLVFGDPLPAEPVTGGVINVNSPLRYDERMLGGLISFARSGQVSIVTPFIMAGAMSPVSMAAALAQQHAEALAGVALTQLVRPGAPVIYGGFTMNVDMRSGSPAFGSPEGAWAILTGAQMARHCGLPYRSSGSLTNAKTADAQSAYEAQWTLWPAILAHANLVLHAAGWVDSGLTVSLEKFVIDLETLAMFRHLLHGFELSGDSFALDMIAEVGPGGHHFGTSHTQQHYESAFFQPFLADRQGYEPWLAGGGHSAEQRANALWKQVLRDYEPPPLDDGIRQALAEFVARREGELQDHELYNQ